MDTRQKGQYQSTTDRICVLICTYDRPQLLRRLLSALFSQVTAFSAATVVIDNGRESSADVVADFQDQFDIWYQRVTEPGLSTARNASLRVGLSLHPKFLALLDDDEVPTENWLSQLLQTMTSTNADIVTGPVMPEFAREPPHWVADGRFFEKSGTNLCTSNLMIRASCIPKDETKWFLPEFNFSGGEDKEFLDRLRASGANHAVAETAFVKEFVPNTRLSRTYIWRRGLRDGVVIAKMVALQCPSFPGYISKIAGRSAQKLGYALNHFFWSANTPWRFNNAMSDLAAIAGMLLYTLGKGPTFYG